MKRVTKNMGSAPYGWHTVYERNHRWCIKPTDWKIADTVLHVGAEVIRPSELGEGHERTYVVSSINKRDNTAVLVERYMSDIMSRYEADMPPMRVD